MEKITTDLIDKLKTVKSLELIKLEIEQKRVDVKKQLEIIGSRFEFDNFYGTELICFFPYIHHFNEIDFRLLLAYNELVYIIKGVNITFHTNITDGEMENYEEIKTQIEEIKEKFKTK
ncbi:MAG: hypothetical protein IPO21_07265 [Bacteroidales bacterium]|nr:hypothetical protein [Bacteroidales bacterium]